MIRSIVTDMQAQLLASCQELDGPVGLANLAEALDLLDPIPSMPTVRASVANPLYYHYRRMRRRCMHIIAPRMRRLERRGLVGVQIDGAIPDYWSLRYRLTTRGSVAWRLHYALHRPEALVPVYVAPERWREYIDETIADAVAVLGSGRR